MSEPFISQITMYGFNYAPRAWAKCDGQIMPINQNQSLYSLLGTTYGGDGRTSFGLPEMRGRAPIHFDTAHPRGQKAGIENETLTTQQMPNHNHALEATSNSATTTEPAGKVFATATQNVYHTLDNSVNMAASAISHAGGGQHHNNMQPYETINFCICLQGLFPSRN